jgi:hypothetical protein
LLLCKAERETRVEWKGSNYFDSRLTFLTVIPSRTDDLRQVFCGTLSRFTCTREQRLDFSMFSIWLAVTSMMCCIWWIH